MSIKDILNFTKDLSVLYVEDDLSIQTKMQKYLQKLFAQVTVADDGEQGMRLFKERAFDLVITDLSMPRMNGTEMIREIKSMDNSQSILITTAYTDPHYLMEAIKSHVDGYILKPFNYDELNDELAKVSKKIQTFKKNEEYKQHLQSMLERQKIELSENYERTLYSIVDLIEQRDTYTAGHSKRVAYYCEIIAKAMGYSQEESTLIRQAGILHDVGKIETPDSILLNPKGLNTLEYKLIQEHVSVGHKLLSNIPMFRSLAPIVYAHHEKYDGSGYPNGLEGEEIHYLARIMIVADAFDAMTTNRIYKARRTIEEAIEEIQRLSGKHFDPQVVQYAIKVLQEVKIDEDINQLPKTKLEQERFAYFYNDTISPLYNQNYLSVNLLKNDYEHFFQEMTLITIQHFSSYNKKYGWKAGDRFLEKFATILYENIENASIFRIFGDDFVILSKEPLSLERLLHKLDTLTKESDVSYSIKKINLKEQSIKNLTDIEELL